MRAIYIIDEHVSSKFNGVGTFMAAMMPCLKNMDVRINIISFNEETRDFCIEEGNDCTIYKVPTYGGLFLENAFPSLSLLRLHIKDSAGNLFLVSYCPSHVFLDVLKTLFPRSKRVVAIHDQMWTAPLLGDATMYKSIIRGEKTKGTDEALRRQIRRNMRVEQKMFRLSHHVVCLSRSTQTLLHDVYQMPEDKISLIPNGIDAHGFADCGKTREALREELGLYADEKVLLFSGRAVKAKGVFHLLKAFETLWAEDHRLRLVVVGIMEAYPNYASLVGGSITHVTFTGLIPREKVRQWYKAADIGVLPSFTEQCSYTGLEMMAARLLVVTTNGHGLSDMFDGSCALTVDAKDETLADSLTATLRRALAISVEDRERMLDAAYKRVTTEYSLERMQKGYSELVEKLLGE